MSKEATKRDREGTTTPTTNADEEHTDEILANAQRNQTGFYSEGFLSEANSPADNSVLLTPAALSPEKKRNKPTPSSPTENLTPFKSAASPSSAMEVFLGDMEGMGDITTPMPMENDAFQSFDDKVRSRSNKKVPLEVQCLQRTKNSICKYCKKRNKGKQRCTPTKEWRVTNTKSKIEHKHGTKQENLELIDELIDFVSLRCAGTDYALGGLVLYIQMRESGTSVSEMLTTNHMYACDDIQHQKRLNHDFVTATLQCHKRLLRFNLYVKDYKTWATNLSDGCFGHARSKNAQWQRSNPRIRSYVDEWFNIGYVVNQTMFDVLTRAQSYKYQDMNSVEWHRILHQFNLEEKNIPKHLQELWMNVRLANLFRQMGKMDRAYRLLNMNHLYQTNKSYDNSNDNTPAKFVLDTARTLLLRILCVQERREKVPNRKHELQVELMSLYDTIAQRSTREAVRLFARYQKIEYEIDHINMDIDNVLELGSKVQELEQICYRYQILQQQQQQQQQQENGEDDTKATSSSSSSSFTTTTSSISTLSYTSNTVKEHHVKLSIIKAKYKCQLANFEETKQALVEEHNFRMQTYGGLPQRHCVDIIKVLAKHLCHSQNLEHRRQALVFFQQAFDHATDMKYKESIGKRMTKLRNQLESPRVEL